MTPHKCRQRTQITSAILFILTYDGRSKTNLIYKIIPEKRLSEIKAIYSLPTDNVSLPIRKTNFKYLYIDCDAIWLQNVDN